jgi:FKBP-type peptidyl-prolyl cis-trans isomerase FklB
MRRARFVGGWLMLFVVSGWVFAQEDLPVAGGVEGGIAAAPDALTASQYSYAIGLEIGDTFRSGELPLDVESLLAGARDGLIAAQPKFDRETCDQAMQAMGRFRMQSHIARNREYLEKNSQAEGVQVLPSGLQYKVLKEGAGASPTAEDRVRVHYRGELIDGTVFDSSFERNEPAEFRVDGVISGWTEALQLMKVGSRWQLVIPSELAYRETGRRGAIPPHATLVFEVELLGIE